MITVAPEQFLLLIFGSFVFPVPSCLPWVCMVSTLDLSVGMRAGLGITAQFAEYTPNMHLTLASTASVTFSPHCCNKAQEMCLSSVVALLWG